MDKSCGQFWEIAEAPIQLLRLFDWLPSFLQSSQRLCLQIFCEFQLAICSRWLQIALSNLPIKIAILWDNIAMLLTREHPV